MDDNSKIYYSKEDSKLYYTLSDIDGYEIDAQSFSEKFSSYSKDIVFKLDPQLIAQITLYEEKSSQLALYLSELEKYGFNVSVDLPENNYTLEGAVHAPKNEDAASIAVQDGSDSGPIILNADTVVNVNDPINKLKIFYSVSDGKLYYPISDISVINTNDAEFEVFTQKYRSYGPDIVIQLAPSFIPQLIIYEHVKKSLLNYLHQLKNYGFNITINVPANDNSKPFTADEMKLFDELKAAKTNPDTGEETNEFKITFNGGVKTDYDMNELSDAQKNFNTLFSKIKSQPDLSPFEKYLFIYDYLTRKIYHENPDQKENSRDVIAIMQDNGVDIVCVGYAQLMEYMCNVCGIPCFTQKCRVYDKSGKNSINHQNNVVYINDPKYGIKGYFYSDACWDHVEKGFEDKKTYSFCLIPLSDKNLMDRKIKIIDDSLFYYSDPENFSKLVDGEFYGETFGKSPDGEDSKMIKSLGLGGKYDLNKAYAHAICSDSLTKQRALMALKEVFEKNGIPKDVYAVKTNVPYGCSFEFFLSLLMLQKIPYSRLKEKIDDCQGVYESKKNVSIFKGVNPNILYTKMIELRKYFYSNQRLSISDSAHCYSGDIVAKINKMINGVSNNSDPEFQIIWENVEKRIAKIFTIADVMRTLDLNSQDLDCKPIPLQAYEDALKVVYKLESQESEKAIEKKVKDAIQDTEYISQHVYTQTAKNCFKNNSPRQIEKNPQNPQLY